MQKTKQKTSVPVWFDCWLLLLTKDFCWGGKMFFVLFLFCGGIERIRHIYKLNYIQLNITKHFL